MKTKIRIAIVLLISASSVAAKAEVSASLDRDQIGVGESVELILERDSRGGDAPDLSPLKKDFDILGTSSGSNIQIVNGHMSSHNELRLNLSPKHSGTLGIPSLIWGNEKTSAVQLTVTDAAAGNPATSGDAANGATTVGSSHLFVTSTLDQKQPYVQGTVVLTVAVHADQPFQQASLDFSGNNDVSVQALGKDQQTSEIRNGHRFEVIERKYLLLPQRSGAITVNGPTFDAQVQDPNARDPFANDSFFGRAFGGMPGMFNATRPLRLHGDDIRLNVRARPANASGRDWLPASHVTLEEDWKPDGASVQASEPLTLHLRLSAEGLSAAQLPDLSAQLALPDGLKAYPDQAKLDTNLKSGEVVGSRDQDIALIGGQAGHYRIPPIKLSWWDTVQDVQREIVLPEHTVDVVPGAGAPIGIPAPSAPLANPMAPRSAHDDPAALAIIEPRTASRSPWMWVSLALGALWIGSFAVLLWRFRQGVSTRSKVPPVSSALPDPIRAGDACKAFHQACLNNDPQAAQQALLRWARRVWNAAAPTGLNALARRLNDQRITELLQELDRACYSGGHWLGAPLSQTLTSLPTSAVKIQKSETLAGLYDPTA